MDKELLRLTYEDLVHIAKTFTADSEDATIRRESALLRRLLVDGDLIRAWRSVGYDKSPKIIAPTLQFHLRDPNAPKLYFAAAIGGTVGDCKLSNVCAFKHQPGLSIKIPKELGADNFSLPLNTYLEEISVVVEGQQYRRREILKYVANQLGGVHYDKERDDALTLLQKHEVDVSTGGRSSRRRNLLFLELLSMGQCVTGSPNVQELMRRAAEQCNSF